jgi:hypothetical protein
LLVDEAICFGWAAYVVCRRSLTWCRGRLLSMECCRRSKSAHITLCVSALPLASGRTGWLEMDATGQIYLSHFHLPHAPWSIRALTRACCQPFGYRMLRFTIAAAAADSRLRALFAASGNGGRCRLSGPGPGSRMCVGVCTR